MKIDETRTNELIAEQICRELRWDAREFTFGDCVALLDGKVVGVAKDLEGALQALRATDPDAQRGMVFEVAPAIPDMIR